MHCVNALQRKYSLWANLLSDGSGYVDSHAVSESRMPTVVREVTSDVATVRSSFVDKGRVDVDRSFTDDSVPALQSVDGNTMLGAVNRIADVSISETN